MPYKSGHTIKRYRVTVEQLTHYTESPTHEELKAPQLEGSTGPQARTVEEWVEVDVVTTADAATFAGALESIAKRYKPDQAKVMH